MASIHNKKDQAGYIYIELCIYIHMSMYYGTNIVKEREAIK